MPAPLPSPPLPAGTSAALPDPQKNLCKHNGVGQQRTPGAPRPGNVRHSPPRAAHPQPPSQPRSTPPPRTAPGCQGSPDSLFSPDRTAQAGSGAGAFGCCPSANPDSKEFTQGLGLSPSPLVPPAPAPPVPQHRFTLHTPGQTGSVRLCSDSLRVRLVPRAASGQDRFGRPAAPDLRAGETRFPLSPPPEPGVQGPGQPARLPQPAPHL